MKRKLVTLAIDFLTSRAVSSLMGSIRRTCVPVFMLHRMEDKTMGLEGHTQQQLRSALEYLMDNGYTVISIRHLIQSVLDGSTLPNKAVAFTIDDGFYDQADFALPIFQEFNAPVTFFIATNMLDKSDWSWDFKLEYIVQKTLLEKLKLNIAGKEINSAIRTHYDKRKVTRELRLILKEVPNKLIESNISKLSEYCEVEVPDLAPMKYRSITWDRARELESDIIEFAPHTCSHVILSNLDDASAEHEIHHSWIRLQQELKHPVPVFCYPTGRSNIDFGKREKKIAKNIGMIAGFSADPGYVNLKPNYQDLFDLKRFSFPNDLIDFMQYCSWIEKFKEKVFRFN